MTLLTRVLIGAGAGALRVVVGWLKAEPVGEPWDTWKALRTVGLAVLLGGLTAVYLEGTWTEVLAAVFLETVALEEIMVGGYRKVTR